MANGIYAAAAGIAAQQTRIDSITNDLANSDTPGYKTERVAFTELLYGSEGGVPVGSGVAAIDLGPSATPGQIGNSTNHLAVAIDGTGFFQVRRGTGQTALTKDGDFQMDARGNLVTSTGQQLVPPVKLPTGTDQADVTISTNGTISVRSKVVGKIQIVQVAVPAQLQAVGDSLYATTRASGSPTAVAKPNLLQAQIEDSNVNVEESMSEMLDAQQNYSMLSHAIQTQDQLLQIANQMRAG